MTELRESATHRDVGDERRGKRDHSIDPWPVWAQYAFLLPSAIVLGGVTIALCRVGAALRSRRVLEWGAACGRGVTAIYRIAGGYR